MLDQAVALRKKKKNTKNKSKLARKGPLLLCQEEPRSMESPDRRLHSEWMWAPRRDTGWDGVQAGRAGCPDAPGGSLLPSGLQTVLPPHLRERFVAAALSYIACGSAGELLCRRSDCRCQCQPAFPHCNCPEADVQALEGSLAQLHRAWESHHGQFEESGEAEGKLPRCWDPGPKATPCLKPSGQP